MLVELKRNSDCSLNSSLASFTCSSFAVSLFPHFFKKEIVLSTNISCNECSDYKKSISTEALPALMTCTRFVS